MSVLQGFALTGALILGGFWVIYRHWRKGHEALRREIDDSRLSDL